MEQTSKPVSKTKVFLLWAIAIGNVIFWVWFWTWRHRNDATATPQEQDTALDIAKAIFMAVTGGLFLVMGAACYFIVIATQCLTLDFSRPVFSGYKGRLYLAKIVVPVLVSVGIGVMLLPFAEPLLRGLGLTGQLPFMVPILVPVIAVQIILMWVNIWAPVTRKLIAKRLAACGILPAQLQTALLTGISDPSRSSFKKMTLVEDDIGALWIAGDRIVYWGDTEQFAVLPDQLIQLERRADAGSTSMLSGTAHVILHVQLPDGNVRQIRLHTEGQWTQGRNKKAMDALAAAISNWYDSTRAIAPPPAQTV
ncbi:MAG: hypothetical protein C5B50_01525 [Verrucomicrobia bacterium]|nr:MAG: hypothetical protein C5B50_01525 [Verrucomicrobiota bacterium]